MPIFLVEKWKGKTYRLVIQRQKRMNGELDLWEGEYTYRCILTNDYESSEREVVILRIASSRMVG